MKSAFRNYAFYNNGRVLRLLQCGTALPLLATAIPALAAPIQESSDGDIVIEATEASGTPIAVELESTGGSIDVSVTTVTGTAVAGDRDYVVGLETLTDGSITAAFDSITGTGDGELLGLGAESVDGAIDLTVGTVDVSGLATSGITAHSNSGTVSITADSVIARGTEMDSQAEFFEAVQGVSDNNSVTIDVGHAETYGYAGSAIGAIAGGTATIVADTAVAHAENVIVAYANSAGDASVDIGSVTLTAEDGQGVYISSTGGNATLAVDTIETGDLAEAARVLAYGDIDVTLGDVNAGGGLTATSSSGDVSVAVNGDIVGRTYGGMGLTGQNVSVTMAEGSSITAAGETWNGIFAQGSESVTLDVTDVDTTGQSIRAVSQNGPVVIDVSGEVVSHENNAISVAGNGATVTVAEGGSVTSGGGSAAIAINGRSGDVTITNAGTVAATGNGESAIGTTTAGNVLITSNLARVSSSAAPVSGFQGAGLSGVSNGGGNVTIDSDTIEVTGPDRVGIYASVIDAGLIDITSGAITTDGVNGHGILASSGLGAVTIESGSISTAGAGSFGVNVTTGGGDVSIVSESVQTSGAGEVFGISAFSNGGGITIDSGTVEVASSGADNGRGIHANSGGGDIVINAGTTTGHTRAIFTTTLFEGPELGFTAGNTTITSEAATATGGNAIIGQGYSVDLTSGLAQATANADFTAATIYVSAGAGGATVAADETIAHGFGQYGIQVLSIGDQEIVSGSVSTDGQYGNGITAYGNSAITVNSGTISTLGADSHGIFVDGYTEYGSDPVTITSGTITTAGNRSNGIQVTAAEAGVVIDSGTIATAGNIGSAILVNSTGTVEVSADVVTVAGAGADPGVRPDGSGYRIEQGGVIVESGDAAISIAAGTVEVEGQHRYGISARGIGTIEIAADEVTLASADSVAVVARGGAGDVSITTGAVTTTGASGVGVFADTTSGNIVIEAGTTRVENEGFVGNFTGDAVVATSVSGTVSVTSENAYSAALYGTAVAGVSGGAVTVVSGTAETTGDGGVGLYALSTGADASLDSGTFTATGADVQAITVSAANGTATLRADDVTALGENAAGIRVVGQIADVTVDGTVETTLAAVSAQGLETHVVINGAVSSSEAAGIISIAQQGFVEVAEGGSVTATGSGVVLLGNPQSGGFTQFYNSGTVHAVNGPAVVGTTATPNSPPADYYIQNNGTLVGESGLAVWTGAGDDVLELTNLSQITGIANLGDGDDRLVLDFNDDAPEGAVGQVVSTVNVEGLSVDSGSWRAEGAQSLYDFVEIEEGATLTVVENEQGSLAVETGLVELDGVLRLDLSVEETEGDLGETTIVGGGSLHLIGTATVELTDATGLQHTGGTFVENGELLLTTVYGGDIATSGDGVFELGEGGDFTGNLVNDGTFVFSQAGDYDFLGDFTGSGQLDKYGDGTLTFAGLYGFEGTTSVLGGTVAFTGQLSEDTALDITEGTVDLSQVEGGEQTIAELSGEGGELQLGETQLVIQQLGNTVFSGSITGMGSLIKDGEGDLKLDGDGTGFTGTGQVDGGTMSVNGDFSNAGFVVNEGGTLGGAGTIGSAQVNGGGTLAPGNSIDTLTVNGDVTFTAASVFEVEVDAAGNSDLLQATGTATLGGASVNVIAESGIYRPLTDYTILTADGGVSGEFSSVDINLAFLDPTLAYSANAVTLRLVRNDIDFAAYGQTANQAAIGGLIESFGYGNALYDATLTLVDSDVAPSFASLTGEVYPAYSAATVETAEMLRRQTTGAMAGEGAYAWATGLYNNVSSGSGAGDIELVGKGVAGGFGFGGSGFSATLGLGMLDQGNGGGDFADGDVTFAIGQLAYTGMAGLSISAGAQLGWIDGETRRQTSLGTAGGAVSGGIDGDYLQLFGEIAYSIPAGGLALEPFVGISHVAVEFDSLNETGAPTALAVGAIDRDVTFGDVGVRLSGDAGSGIRPFASAAYRHAWGDRASLATVGFAGTAGTVPIAATPIAQDAAELSAGLAITRGQVEIEVGYDGTISKAFDSHGLSAALRFRF